MEFHDNLLRKFVAQIYQFLMKIQIQSARQMLAESLSEYRPHLQINQSLLIYVEYSVNPLEQNLIQVVQNKIDTLLFYPHSFSGCLKLFPQAQRRDHPSRQYRDRNKANRNQYLPTQTHDLVIAVTWKCRANP